jgi:hypothetical protein
VEQRATASLFDGGGGFLPRFIFQFGNRHRRTFPAKTFRDGTTDSVPASGHDGYPFF